MTMTQTTSDQIIRISMDLTNKSAKLIGGALTEAREYCHRRAMDLCDEPEAANALILEARTIEAIQTLFHRALCDGQIMKRTNK